MIFTKRKITITGDKASMDKQIVLYRGDREVEVQFEIVYETIKYRKTNAIEDVNASFGQLVIQNDSVAIPTVTDVSPTSEGVVIFKFTKEMIDEITELGTYDFQIRLFDDTQTSRITTPTIEDSIIIKEPLSMYEGDTAEVGVAVTGVAKIQEEEYLEPFDEAGNYNETTWVTGDIITSGKLNKLEDGITGVNQKVEGITIPTKTSDLTNDSGFITSIPSEYVTDTELNSKGYLTEHQDLSGYAPIDNPSFTGDLSIGNSLTMGSRTGEIGENSIAEGYSTTASAKCSHAEGVGTTAIATASHAEGAGTVASGVVSHSEGDNTIASGYGSHAEGDRTIASSDHQHVQGKFNIEDTENKYAHIVGNGMADTARSNAHTLDWNGNGWYQGKLSQEGTPTEDKDLTTKKYVDDKTEILPVKNNYIIFEDAVPSRTEVASNGFEYYIFDSLQNEDMIISAVKYNLNVTFNDGTNDRTMDLIIERSLKGGVFCEKDGIAVQVSYSETNHAIRMILVNANDYTQYSILKATLNCDSYSNLLQDYHIENINYDKIKEVPSALNSIANYENFTLKGKEYYELYDNLSIWDANKFNERLDENSGVKRNEFFKLPGKDNYKMQINQKDSEGIGFGQHISIDNSKNVHIVADAGVDVIIKIYNSTTKELIDTLNYCEAGFYKTRIINKDYLNGVTSIFIAFTVKDSTESFYGNTQVNDLIVHYDSSFLVKEEILTKTNTKEYIPTGDYNPATKKYVDEKIASIDTTIDNTLPVNGSLNLTTSKFQTTTLASDTEVILPTVKVYTEIHLFFLGISGTNILDTNVAWNNKPTIEDNKKYEFIYTYVNSEIGWLGKAVVYTV